MRQPCASVSTDAGGLTGWGRYGYVHSHACPASLFAHGTRPDRQRPRAAFARAPQHGEGHLAAAPRYRTTARFAIESIEGLVLAPLIVLSWPVAKRWLSDWGSTPAERARAWPGDALAPAAVAVHTRAVDVSAPAEVVWRWVVQFGLGRAGFYSYEMIERMVGIPVRNVESILPDHQDLSVGQEIKLHPETPGIPVGMIAPGQHVCFGEPGAMTERTPDPRRSWSIYVVPTAQRSARLIVRSCIEGLRAPTVGKRLGLTFEAPVDFAMEQRMLRTVRRLSERRGE